MISEMLERSKIRPECANNYLAPHLDTLILMIREFESLVNDRKLVKPGNYKKGSFLLREGEMPGHSWFITEGIARCFSFTNGVEIIRNFFFPCEFMGLFGREMVQDKSPVSIQLLTESEVYAIDMHCLAELEPKFPILYEIERLISVSYSLWIDKMFLDFQVLTARERYKQLVMQHPSLLKHVSLTHIASFLSIKPETLSRIRKKILI